MSNLELHANILDTLILNQAPYRLPIWFDDIFTAILSIFVIYIILTVTPLNGLWILASTLLGLSLLSYLLLAFAGIWMEITHPFVAIFVTYYLFVPYRLIIEYRKSWEYYHRNQLLTQVEELKSNFLRMMSHDLKTPLARIQGMTDVVLNDSAHLSKQQLQAIRTIQKSSEELSEFIGSILNLGRIESKDIKLHLKSKDINTLLSEAIRKCDFLAREKNIQIIPEFEPMFSVKLDPDLMGQVFTNLIENAIKYSPENSKILISTEELEGHIIVQVADQGIGIPKEELDTVFSKFYRSAKASQSSVKGSGLGLYLAQYFVKLHKGQITVESEENVGSTFTIDLPMNMDHSPLNKGALEC